MHAVQPAYVSEGWRGVAATQELSSGHVDMKVHQAMLLSVFSAKQDAVPITAGRLAGSGRLAAAARHTASTVGCRCTPAMAAAPLDKC